MFEMEGSKLRFKLVRLIEGEFVRVRHRVATCNGSTVLFCWTYESPTILALTVCHIV